LRDITAKNTPNVRGRSAWDKFIADEAGAATSNEEEIKKPKDASIETPDQENYIPVGDEGPVIGDEPEIVEEEFRMSEEPPPHFDDEEADQTFELEPLFPQRTKANSRRKRRSDLEVPTSPPPPKRARKSSYEPQRQQTLSSEPQPAPSPSVVAESSKAAPKPRGRPPLKAKSANTKLSARIPKAIDDVVQKIRARPNAPKSLYILRRETPAADDGATRTRSGRTSFKPLAWWRNEQCVYGGSPGAGIADGARFPLNSIKEIIRTEESVEPMPKSKKRKRKGKGKAAGRSRSKTPAADDSESEEDEDPDAEPWETEVGTLKGNVSVWDAQAQAPLDEEEEIDIAYAPAAIETSTVKVNNSGPTFKYAKLLGNKFMGVGLVDLEPGGIKRPKNSRKMHMSFFVVKGRVTVHVGPAGPDRTDKWTSFSIGKGGFWQVPRGKFIYSPLHKGTLT
jgi:centromere protein C